MLELIVQPDKKGLDLVLGDDSCYGMFLTLCDIEEAIDAYHGEGLQEVVKEKK